MKLWQSITFIIICLLLIISGVVCGTLFCRSYFAKSVVNGAGFDVDWTYSVENFKYEDTCLSFYLDNDNVFRFKKDFPAVIDFDSEINKYELTLNGYPCLSSNYKPGSIDTVFAFEFRNTDGDIVTVSNLSIKLSFLSNSTKLLVENLGSSEDMKYISQFFNSNGFHLKVDKIIKGVI